jgi:hypothetical protein
MKPTTIAKLKQPEHKEHFNRQVNLIIEEFVFQSESRERVKDILAELKERLEISPAIVRKLAKAKADEKLEKLLEENSEVVNLTQILDN